MKTVHVVENGVVVNSLVWDGVSDLPFTVIEIDGAEIGDSYSENKLTKKPVEAPSIHELEAIVQSYKNKKLGEFRAAREAILNQIVGIAFFADKSGDQALVAACAAARQGLLNLPQDASVIAASDIATFKSAMAQAYAAVAAPAPTALRQALKVYKS